LSLSGVAGKFEDSGSESDLGLPRSRRTISYVRKASMHSSRLKTGRPLRVIKPISGSLWNDGYRADSGPSRGGIRPNATSTAAICNVRFTSTPAGRIAQTPVIQRRVSERLKSTEVV
jgi:hypothetical protein